MLTHPSRALSSLIITNSSIASNRIRPIAPHFSSQRRMTSPSIPYTVPLPGGIPDTHRPFCENTTTILVHKDNTAFLNPVQQYNRDLSVACIRAWNEMRKEEAEARWRRKYKGKKGKGKGKKEEGQGEQGAEAEQAAERPYKASRFTILEALSATGLRSIRYAKEIPDVSYILANDLSPSACEAMRTNVALNGVSEPFLKKNGESSSSGQQKAGASTSEGGEVNANVNGSASATETIAAADVAVDEESGANGELTDEERMEAIGRREGCTGYVKINEGDACTLMYNHRTPSSRVDVVDLDPYGSAAPFIDAAIGSIADGGLLCITCTDLAVLAGSQYPEKAFSQYGGVSVHAEYSHEVALRLVLNSLAQCAARYGRYIKPLLSFSIDFYVRLFVRIDTQPVKVKELASQIGSVSVCGYCQDAIPQPFGRVNERTDKSGNAQRTFKIAPLEKTNDGRCEHCGGSLHVGGPMWLGPIQDKEFAGRVLSGIEGQQDKYKTWTRMHGMLTVAHEELPNPFYFTTNRLHAFFNASSGPTSSTISALLNAGYKVSRSHASSGSLKTDAPRAFLYDIVREYAKTTPVRVDKIPEGSPARKLNETAMTYEINTQRHPDSKKLERGDKVVFYQVNPTANWGPGSRAKTVKNSKDAGAGAAGTKVEKRKADALDGDEGAFGGETGVAGSEAEVEVEVEAKAEGSAKRVKNDDGDDEKAGAEEGADGEEEEAAMNA